MLQVHGGDLSVRLRSDVCDNPSGLRATVLEADAVALVESTEAAGTKLEAELVVDEVAALNEIKELVFVQGLLANNPILHVFWNVTGPLRQGLPQFAQRHPVFAGRDDSLALDAAFSGNGVVGAPEQESKGKSASELFKNKSSKRHGFEFI